jgi:hypothetical protein
MSSSNSARVIAVGRRVFPWLVGPAVMVMRGRGLELAGPSACPGLLEVMSIAAVRLGSNVSIGAVFVVLYAIAMIAGLAVFVELVFHRTRNMAVAASTGVAVGVSPLFGLTLSPPWEAAAFGMCAAAALLSCVLLDRRTRTSYTSAIAGLGILLAAALLVPPWLIVAVTAAFVIVATTSSRLGRAGRLIAAAAAAAGLALVALIVLNLSRPDALTGPSSWHTLAACALPMPSPKRAMGLASTVVWLFGPFALALAVLGLFVEANRVAWRRAVLTASIGIVSVVLAAGTAMSPHVALAPLAVGLWWLAGSGLREIISGMGTTPILRVMSVLVLVLLPTLEASRRGAEERDDWVRPRGHEKQTLRQMTGMLNLVSPGARFVEEDSTVDALLRAAVVGGRRTSKPFTVVARSSDIVRHALSGGPVYVFPRAQEDLSLRGFAIEPLRTIEGVGEITATRPCRIVGDTWADLPGTSGRIAMSADSETVRGPVLMYLGGSTAAEPRPDGWPPRTTRGFHFFTFDQSGGPSDRLVAEARDARLATDHAALAQPFVIRLTLHRTPRAPLALAVVVGAPFPRGVAKLEREGAEAGHFTICEAPAIQITPLG